MLSITELPVFGNYQSDLSFLKLLGHESGNFCFLNYNNISIPLIIKKYNSEYWHGYTPIHFQCPGLVPLFGEHEDVLHKTLFEKGCLTYYIQTKEIIPNEKAVVSIPNALTYKSRYRTNYYFNLLDSIDEIKGRQKKDAKYRLNKALKENYDLNINNQDVSSFVKCYNEIAKDIGFNDNYFFEKVDLKKSLLNRDIYYLELINDSKDFLAGGIFTCFKGDVDYLYGADSFILPDSIRVLIFEALKFFKSKGKEKLFLGGGVKEDDSLAIFKQRMGTNKQVCNTVMGVTDIKTLEKTTGEVINENVFNTFFPNFVNYVFNK